MNIDTLDQAIERSHHTDTIIRVVVSDLEAALDYLSDQAAEGVHEFGSYTENDGSKDVFAYDPFGSGHEWRLRIVEQVAA